MNLFEVGYDVNPIDTEIARGWNDFEAGDDFNPSESEKWQSGWRQAQQFWFNS